LSLTLFNTSVVRVEHLATQFIGAILFMIAYIGNESHLHCELILTNNVKLSDSVSLIYHWPI